MNKQREDLIQAVLRRVSSERYREDDPHYADELEYCDDMILDAAKQLVAGVNDAPKVTEKWVVWSTSGVASAYYVGPDAREEAFRKQVALRRTNPTTDPEKYTVYKVTETWEVDELQTR